MATSMDFPPDEIFKSHEICLITDKTWSESDAKGGGGLKHDEEKGFDQGGDCDTESHPLETSIGSPRAAGCFEEPGKKKLKPTKRVLTLDCPVMTIFV
jgi:hypothetical protein